MFTDNLLSILFCFGLVLYAFASIRNVLKEKGVDPQLVEDAVGSNRDCIVFYGNKPGITDEDILRILADWHPYYKNLHPSLQTKFANRVKQFIQKKIFIIRSKDGFKEMPVLTSAAAVQLTFGLDDFLLPWFDFIQVYTEQYFDDDSLKVLDGNVYGKTITVAWSQLLKGNSDDVDGVNVGVHEMAHALYFQKVVLDKKDKIFKNIFADVMKEGETIFSKRSQEPLLFRDYAFRNMQEFWAESIEIFFEQPEYMQKIYTDFFNLIAKLLRQDPRNKLSPLMSKQTV